MPLRDHFRPPVDDFTSWEQLDGMWPAAIVQHLRTQLPDGYVAGPTVHAGSRIEIDVGAFEDEKISLSAPWNVETNGGGGVATAVWAQPEPTVSVETSLPDYDEFEVRVYDARRGRHLVAAIEIVSPANKDRPEHRNAFVGKCAALLRNHVAVSIVDLVTVRQANLYAELLAFVGQKDSTLGAPPIEIYAASCRWLHNEQRARLETWSYPMSIGKPLPTIPLCLSPSLIVPLDLEKSYEQACHDLWIK